MANIGIVQNCCGCRSCEQLCPTKCIRMIEDDEGFLRPYIVESKCIDCGACLRGCAQYEYEKKNSVLHTYAALHRNHETVMHSSSGGGMTALAEVVLNKGGVVFGTYLDCDEWDVKFDFGESIEKVKSFRGSKYVQADTKDSYSKVRQYIKVNRPVLYVGTPCQVAGLYKFLGSMAESEQLYTVDILCHGVPSKKLLKGHIEYLETKYGKPVTEFAFRDKSKFPNKHAVKYIIGGSEYDILGKCDLYSCAFKSWGAIRMCCFECKYATDKRVGDVTLGDYWGIRKLHPEFDNSDGASLVLVNTHKGEMLLAEANIDLLASDIKKAKRGNGILSTPPKKPPFRERFYEDINTFGYEKTVRKNVKIGSPIYNAILTHVPQKIIKYLARI